MEGLDWNLVRTFLAVGEQGSLAAGAERLGLAHPTVARHLRDLQSYLGVTLFVRTARGLVLNEAGSRLLAEAQGMHQSAQRFFSSSEGVRTQRITDIRITASGLFADQLPYLVQRIDALRFPDVKVNLLVDEQLLNLLEREADIAIRHQQPQQSELICRQVGSLPLAVLAAPAYVEEFGLLEADNLQRHKVVDSLSRPYFVRGAQEAGWPLEEEQVVFRSDSIACRRAAVRAGWGIGLFTGLDPTDTLIEARQHPQPVSLPVWLVGRPALRENSALAAIFRCLGDALQSLLDPVPV